MNENMNEWRKVFKTWACRFYFYLSVLLRFSLKASSALPVLKNCKSLLRLPRLYGTITVAAVSDIFINDCWFIRLRIWNTQGIHWLSIFVAEETKMEVHWVGAGRCSYMSRAGHVAFCCEKKSCCVPPYPYGQQGLPPDSLRCLKYPHIS